VVYIQENGSCVGIISIGDYTVGWNLWIGSRQWASDLFFF